MAYAAALAVGGLDGLRICRDAIGQHPEPRLDVVSEEANANQYDDRDRGDQQPVLDNVLTIFFANELANCIHAPKTPDS